MHPFHPIFREVMLLDAWQSMNWLKKVSWRNFLFWNRGFSSRKKGHNNYVIYQISENGNFSLKRSFENLVHEIFFPSPQTRRQVSAHGSLYMEVWLEIDVVSRPLCEIHSEGRWYYSIRYFASVVYNFLVAFLRMIIKIKHKIFCLHEWLTLCLLYSYFVIPLDFH